jgi:hypothetical protein
LNLKPDSAPLLAGEVVNADQQGACASMNTIIDELPQTIPNSHVISTASAFRTALARWNRGVSAGNEFLTKAAHRV